MPTELQLLKKRAAELRKMMRSKANEARSCTVTSQTGATHSNFTGSHHTSERQRNAAVAREKTLTGRIAQASALLSTGTFRTIEQLAVAMDMTAPQVRWALVYAKQRGNISPKDYPNLTDL